MKTPQEIKENYMGMKWSSDLESLIHTTRGLYYLLTDDDDILVEFIMDGIFNDKDLQEVIRYCKSRDYFNITAYIGCEVAKAYMAYTYDERCNIWNYAVNAVELPISEDVWNEFISSDTQNEYECCWDECEVFEDPEEEEWFQYDLEALEGFRDTLTEDLLVIARIVNLIDDQFDSIRDGEDVDKIWEQIDVLDDHLEVISLF